VINEGLCHEFQRRYFSGERGAMSGLYAECRHITERLAKAYASRHELPIGELDDTVQIIISRVLSRYRNPSYRIYSFAKVLNIEVVHELSDHKGPKAVFQKSIVSLEGIPEPSSKRETANKSLQSGPYFDGISSDPLGARVLLILKRRATYRSSILAIESFVGRKWIYDHGKELFYIWKYLRSGKKSGHGELGYRCGSRDKASDSGDKPAPKKRK
jgi:hypothetical protein